MKRLAMVVFTAALAGSAGSALAQKPAQPSKPRSPAPPEGCVSTEPGKVECRRAIERAMGPRLDSMMMKRAVLGLQLSATGTARDTLGVFVSAVTPKGPAENAGIIEGERIVSINGVDLRVAPGDIEDGYASGLPAHRLQREVGKLSPGSRVNLRVYSGGRVRDVQVTAGRASDLMRTRSMMGFGEGPGGFIFHDGMTPMAPMGEMVPMEPMGPMTPPPQMWRMEIRPEIERRLQNLPRMEMNGENFRMLMPSRIVSPPRTIRISDPNGVRYIDPKTLKVKAEQKAKTKAVADRNLPIV